MVYNQDIVVQSVWVRNYVWSSGWGGACSTDSLTVGHGGDSLNIHEQMFALCYTSYVAQRFYRGAEWKLKTTLCN